MKKTTFLAVAIMIMTACGFASAESSEITTKSSSTEKFYGVILNANANVVLTQTGENSVTIEGDKKSIDQVTTTIENGSLVIGGEDVHGVTVYVTVDDINLIEINGQGRIYGRGPINGDVILLKVNGTGSMKVDVRALSLGMIVKGTGKIIASGSTGESFTRIYGAGNIYKDHLDSFKCSEEKMVMNDDSTPKKRGTLKLHE